MQSTDIVQEPITNVPENNLIQHDPEQTQETQEQINWRKYRESKGEERKQREAAERIAVEKTREAEALKAAMDALLNKPNNSSEISRSSYDDGQESEDDRIQKKVEAALLLREKANEDQRRVREQQEYPDKLKKTYGDFNQVCSVDNLDYLEYHYPEVAAAFKYAPDGFDKWASVYQAVKKLVPNSSSKKDQTKAEKNFNKPQSMAATGATAVGDTSPIKLDDKKRADNWSRMQRIMKGQ